MTSKQLNTPCVGICSTVYGDNVCRGCKRFSSEIINWNAYDNIQKQDVFDRLGNLITKIIETKVRVQEPEILRQQLEYLGIRYRDDQSSYCDIYYLLRAGASQIDNPTNYGFTLQAKYADYNLTDLFTEIEQEYLTLAQQQFKEHQ